MARSPISISDVAAQAGVSRATVSRVLSGRKTEQIASETRRRVESAVAELGYFPNAMARGLARSRTNCIGLVFLHTHQPLHTAESFVLMLDGILEKATHRRTDTLICTSYSWSDGRENISSLLDRRCDGLILVVPRNDNVVVPLLQQHGVPFVLLASRSENPTATLVDTDNEEAAFQATRHLIDQGHRRIIFISSPDQEYFTYATGRFAGYRRALRERGISADPALIVQEDWDNNLKALMARPASERPTAVFGVSDGPALGAMTALQRLGWRVPEDVSVIGFDDIPSAATSAPGLTTIRQPLKRMGERCVEILLELIEEKIAPGYKEVLPFELILRRSVAPIRDLSVS